MIAAMIDANHISERLASLKLEMSDLRVANARYWSRKEHTALDKSASALRQSLRRSYAISFRAPTPLFAFRLVRQTTAGCARVFSRTCGARREQAPRLRFLKNSTCSLKSRVSSTLI